jgi:hypothetical protein
MQQSLLRPGDAARAQDLDAVAPKEKLQKRNQLVTLRILEKFMYKQHFA